MAGEELPVTRTLTVGEPFPWPVEPQSFVFGPQVGIFHMTLGGSFGPEARAGMLGRVRLVLEDRQHQGRRYLRVMAAWYDLEPPMMAQTVVSFMPGQCHALPEDETQGTTCMMMLVDTDTGLLRGIRAFTLSRAASELLWSAYQDFTREDPAVSDLLWHAAEASLPSNVDAALTMLHPPASVLVQELDRAI